MHIEVQVALNFVISYLYNKLPRRRVNIFGEELEKALKDKFQGHWYPEKPFKVSKNIQFSNVKLFIFSLFISFSGFTHSSHIVDDSRLFYSLFSLGILDNKVRTHLILNIKYQWL